MNGRTQFSRALLILAIAGTLGVAGATLQPTTAMAVGMMRSRDSQFSWVSVAKPLMAPVLGLLRALGREPAINSGTDGRLTFLLLASDSRFHSVSRTDTMMVVSIKGQTITAASIPRDTGRIPRPLSMGGGTFQGKANTILTQLLKGTTLDGALDRFEITIEELLRIEIDYRALIWFNGFTTLVDKVDPVTVDVVREIRDGKLVDDLDGPPGVYFPKRTGYAIFAWDPLPNPYCNGGWKNDTTPPIDSRYFCHRALAYMRTRKGPDNSDWVRARRQQEFVFWTIKAIAKAELSGLVSTAQSEGIGKWWTNYPITAGSALDLYDRLQGAGLGKHVVFKPSIYATRIPGTSAYELNLTEVRNWTAQHMN